MMDKEIIRLSSVGSTNDYLQELTARQQLKEGVVVVADEQSAGRGHGNSQWISEKGKNLTFSILLRPDHLPPTEQFVITKIVSVALAVSLEKHLPGHRVRIKWPNDLYVGDDKIAGILIQNSLSGMKIDHSVAGIGLNVNQLLFDAGLPNPTSLSLLTGKSHNLQALLDEIVAAIGEFTGLSRSPGGIATLDQLYDERMYRKGVRTLFSDDEGSFYARITGLGPHGKLMIEMEDGRKRDYGFKEILMAECPDGV